MRFDAFHTGFYNVFLRREAFSSALIGIACEL
jgi:hypothetical protein